MVKSWADWKEGEEKPERQGQARCVELALCPLFLKLGCILRHPEALKEMSFQAPLPGQLTDFLWDAEWILGCSKWPLEISVYQVEMHQVSEEDLF